MEPSSSFKGPIAYLEKHPQNETEIEPPGTLGINGISSFVIEEWILFEFFFSVESEQSSFHRSTLCL
jgi:hypothetical protein